METAWLCLTMALFTLWFVESSDHATMPINTIGSALNRESFEWGLLYWRFSTKVLASLWLHFHAIASGDEGDWP